MMDADNPDEQDSANTGMEYAPTVCSYEEVLNACRVLRARLLFTIGSSKTGMEDSSQSSDTSSTVESNENMLGLLSIQEEALKLSKLSRLAATAKARGSLGDLAGLLQQYAAFQLSFNEKAEELRSVRRVEYELKKTLFEDVANHHQLHETAAAKLKPLSDAENPQQEKLFLKCESFVKDIRFMQVCISEIISHSGVDLRKNDKLKRIAMSVRDPITSVEEFF